jgi:DNA-binding NarL/FixJ family response regulator
MSFAATVAELVLCEPIRVVVAEDQPIVREGVVHVLSEAGFDVVAVAGDAGDLVRKAQAHKPDVVVTDIRMPPGLSDDGLLAAKQIRADEPDIAVLVLSQFLEDRYAVEIVGERTERVGYLLKERVGDLPTFTDAVRRVAAGGCALDPAVVARLVGRPRNSSLVDQLTRREREVLELMAEGRSNQGIADALFITVAAVERRITTLFEKLRIRPSNEHHRRVLAVLAYLRN